MGESFLQVKSYLRAYLVLLEPRFVRVRGTRIRIRLIANRSGTKSTGVKESAANLT
jgi:hypothetical protein